MTAVRRISRRVATRGAPGRLAPPRAHAGRCYGLTIIRPLLSYRAGAQAVNIPAPLTRDCSGFLVLVADDHAGRPAFCDKSFRQDFFFDLHWVQERATIQQMPQHTDIATKYAGALADPIRLGLVAALADRPRTIESLARELEVSESLVLRHARALQTMGLLQSTDETPRKFQLLQEPVFSEGGWEDLPLPARRSVCATVLTQVNAQAVAAVDAGGFDRPDMYLTRTSMRVTEEKWRELASIFGGTLSALGEMTEAAEADESPDPRIQATAVLMLFTGEEHGGDAPSDDEPAPDFDEDEAREHAYSIIEALGRDVVAPSASWDRIEAMAERLRLVARAAMAFEDARQPAPDR
jgi:DNA-binding transcriptional ArsR family regulator